MKIEKQKGKYLYTFDNYLYHYYIDSKTGISIPHGLYNNYSGYGIGYRYHEERKGLWLRYKNRL